MGSPARTLAWVGDKIAGLGTDVRFSRVFRTAPMHRTDQPEYLNQAATLMISMSPHQALRVFHRLEVQAGRQRRAEVRYGPRALDIDILLFGDIVLDSVDLKIPHPLMHRRPFVLHPLLELAPDLRDPRSGGGWGCCLREEGQLY